MANRYLLAIDAGTSGVRCLVTDTRGKPISLARRQWSYETPDHIAPLGKEFNADKFWGIICLTVAEAIHRGGINAGDVAGVSSTSQREGAVFLDKNGKELYAAPNIDLRALMQGLSIDSDFGKDIHAITGHVPSFLFVPAKLKWFEQNEPGTYSRITAVLPISDWIIYRLTGNLVSEVSAACELGLVDIKNRQWSGSLQRTLGLPVDIYPELRTAGTRVGGVTAAAAAETGLPAGTSVALGGADAECGLLGMSIIDQGQTGVLAGWSVPVQLVTESAVIDPQARIWSSCHLHPQRWLLESSAGDAGNAYEWFRNTLFGEWPADRSYAAMDELAQQAPPGSEGALAFLGPTAMNMSRLGLKMGGFLLPVPLSAINMGRGHLIRAALENLCFAIKANCVQLETVSGTKISTMRLGGGLSRSCFLKKTLASVLDAPVSFTGTTDVSALGAAMCAATGAGYYSNLDEATEAMKPGGSVVEPDPLLAAEYSGYYLQWVSTAERLEKLSEAM